jgi:hypothetical protein
MDRTVTAIAPALRVIAHFAARPDVLDRVPPATT